MKRLLILLLAELSLPSTVNAEVIYFLSCSGQALKKKDNLSPIS